MKQESIVLAKKPFQKSLHMLYCLLQTPKQINWKQAIMSMYVGYAKNVSSISTQFDDNPSSLSVECGKLPNMVTTKSFSILFQPNMASHSYTQKQQTNVLFVEKIYPQI